MPVLPDTWFSIELAATTPIPEWNNQQLWVGLEEDATIDAHGRIFWVLRRQTDFHLIR